MFCWYRKLRLEAAADSGRQPRGDDAQHMAACDECRQYYERLQALSQRLRQEAATITADPPAYFTSRTLAALHRRQRHRRPTLMLWPIYASMAVCVFLLIVLAIVHLHGWRVLEREGQGGSSTAAAVVALTSAASKAVAIAESSKVEKLDPLLAAHLTAEMARLEYDMRAAARFVAASLPIVFESSNGAEDGT